MLLFFKIFPAVLNTLSIAFYPLVKYTCKPFSTETFVQFHCFFHQLVVSVETVGHADAPSSGENIQNLWVRGQESRAGVQVSEIPVCRFPSESSRPCDSGHWPGEII